MQRRRAEARQGKGESASGPAAPSREAELEARIRNLEVQVAYERSRCETSRPAASGREAELEARVRGLEAELAAERKAGRNLKVQVTYERQERLAAEARAKTSKSGASTTETPDRDAEIDRLKTTVRELRARLRAAAESKLVQRGIPSKTRNAIIKALHPDQAANPTVESRAAALALFTQIEKAD